MMDALTIAYNAGREAAKHLPADPATFVMAAADADYEIIVAERRVTWAIPTTPSQSFLLAWLMATPGGERTVVKFMLAHGIKRTIPLVLPTRA